MCLRPNSTQKDNGYRENYLRPYKETTHCYVGYLTTPPLHTLGTIHVGRRQHRVPTLGKQRIKMGCSKANGSIR